jgi:hypothetical protein
MDEAPEIRETITLLKLSRYTTLGIGIGIGIGVGIGVAASLTKVGERHDPGRHVAAPASIVIEEE